jgi:hypothetical protein
LFVTHEKETICAVLSPREYRRALRRLSGPFLAIRDLLVAAVGSLVSWLYLYGNTPAAERNLLELKAILFGLAVVAIVESGSFAYRRYHVTPYEHYKSLHAELDATKSNLSVATTALRAIEDAKPDAALQLIDDGTMLYLEITNIGPAAEFYAMLETTGLSQWPKKETFARWDAVHDAERRLIAKGGRARLRLAKRLVGDSVTRTFQWVVYGKTSWEHFERPSIQTAFIGFEQPSDQWTVTLNIDLLAIPDLKNGPREVMVVLRGDGSHTQLA